MKVRSSRDVAATKKVDASTSAAKLTDVYKQQENAAKKPVHGSQKIKESESDWVNKQASRLFDQLVLEKAQ